MKTLHRRCAGLDVHSDSVVACARLTVRTKVTHEVRRFSTTTRDLLELADWLAAQGITHIAMEATGVYWKPIWHILEGRFELVLANAMHIRNVPGRKSDVNDAVWISDLLAHGLIRASFVPPTQIQEVRDLTRTRTQLGREVARHVQRIQKTLEDANIKLTSVISNIMGLSGRRMLKAMIRGETNPAKLAELGSTRLKCPRADLIAALDGRVERYGIWTGIALALIGECGGILSLASWDRHVGNADRLAIVGSRPEIWVKRRRGSNGGDPGGRTGVDWELVNTRVPDIVGRKDRAVALDGSLSHRQAGEPSQDGNAAQGFQNRYPESQHRVTKRVLTIG